MNTSEAKKLRKLIYSVVKIFSSVRKFQFVPIVHRSIKKKKKNWTVTWNAQIIMH